MDGHASSGPGHAPPRRIAFLVFPRLTLLDIVGPYDAIRRVRTLGIDPALRWSFVGTSAEVRDDVGTPAPVDLVLPETPPLDFDLLVVSGGLGVDDLRSAATSRATSSAVVRHLRAWPQDRVVASVCSGSLLLGDAGLLAGRRATTHRTRLEQLRPLCGEVVSGARVVDEGNVVTAGGVTAGIDLGLHLVGRFWGPDAKTRIARQMEWGGV